MVYFQIDLNPIHQHHNQSNLINIGEERDREIEKERERERDTQKEREREIISEMNGDVRQFNIVVRMSTRIIIIYIQLNTIPKN